MNTDLSTFTFLGLGLAGWLVIFIINCFVIAFWGWIWHHSITTRMDQTNEVLNKIAKALTKIAFPKENKGEETREEKIKAAKALTKIAFPKENKGEETREEKIKAAREHSLLEGLIAPCGWTLSDWQKLSKEEKTEVLNKIKANNGEI